MDWSMPGLPDHCQHPELAQIHVHWGGDAILTISSSVVPFSSCPQSFPASGSFQMSQLFTSGGQSIGVSASTSVLPTNTQEWSLEWTGYCMHLCGSLSILWHCLSLGLEWKLTFSSPVVTAEFSKLSGILSAALLKHHLLGFEFLVTLIETSSTNYF